MGEARDVVLLAVLQHVAVESRTDAGSDDHTYGEHDAYPCGHEFEGHSLVGMYGSEGVQQHHAGGTDDDGPFHAFVKSVVLDFEIHEERCRADEDESKCKDVFEMQAPCAGHHAEDAADEVAYQYPVAEHGVLPVVNLHTHSREHVHEHGAGVEDHQHHEEGDAVLDAAELEGVEQKVG